MYLSRKLCKLCCTTTLSWKISKTMYLWFYLTFWVEPLNGSLKLIMFSMCTDVMSQKWLKIHEIIDSSAPLIEISAILLQKKWSENILSVKQMYLIHSSTSQIAVIKHVFLSNALYYFIFSTKLTIYQI